MESMQPSGTSAPGAPGTADTSRQSTSGLAQNEQPNRMARQGARSPRPRASAAHTMRRTDPVDTMATGLGWFSVALGAAELLAPRALDRAVGAGLYPGLTRFCGLRELAAGIGLLTQADPTPWLWSRVAGDAMDLALLGMAIADGDDDERARAVAATVMVAGVTALDVYAARRASTTQRRSAPGAVRPDGSVRVEESVSVNKSAEECYRMWRNFENLPRFMDHLKSVETRGDGQSHWVAKGPADTSVEWDAEVTRDEPNQLLSWRSLEGSDVPNSGAVRFIPDSNGRGTIVSVTMTYEPPAGRVGVAVAKLFGEEPQMQVRGDLRRFKNLLEAGEIPTTEGQPHGPRPVWYKAFGGTNR